VLRLFVTGTTSKSARAIANLRRLCEERLRGEYDLEVVDIYQHPEAAREHQIVAAPTLLKVLPLPLRRIIGDLANEERVLAGLDLKPKVGPKAAE
jgi:circadian clock protein KaiB